MTKSGTNDLLFIQTYKLELPKNSKIYNVFYVSMLKQNITRKGRINEFAEVPEFEPGNNKEYKMKAIQDSAVYAKKKDRHLLGLYYLISWKRYMEEENT